MTKQYTYQVKFLNEETDKVLSYIIKAPSYNDCFQQIFKLEKELGLPSIDLKPLRSKGESK